MESTQSKVQPLSPGVKPEPSILASLIRHERALMVDLCAARREAQRIVETAHIEARRLIEEEEQSLAQELEEMRRRAALVREQDRAGLAAEGRARLEEMRRRAAEQMTTLFQDILDLVLPGAARISSADAERS